MKIDYEKMEQNLNNLILQREEIKNNGGDYKDISKEIRRLRSRLYIKNNYYKKEEEKQRKNGLPELLYGKRGTELNAQEKKEYGLIRSALSKNQSLNVILEYDENKLAKIKQWQENKKK